MALVQNAEVFHHTSLITSLPTAINAENSFPWNQITNGFSAESAFLVSYSELQSYRQCARKHFYSFFKKKAPAVYSAPIQVGTLGHKLLEIYYTLRDTTPLEDILEQITIHYTQEYMRLIENKVRSTVLINMFERVMNFIQTDPFKNYKVLTVEKTFVTPLTNDIGLAFTPDLILQNKKDPDQIKVVDHKFVGKQWTSVRLMMTTQLDVYAAALTYHNIFATNKVYNFLSTVTPLQEPIEVFNINQYKAERIIKEFTDVATLIYEESKLSYEEQLDSALRVLEPMTCQWCPYLDLCYGELTGNEKMIDRAEQQLIPNTYGYRSKEGEN